MLKAVVCAFSLGISAVAATSEACGGIGIMPGEGTVVGIDKDHVAKQGATVYDASDDALILAHGSDSLGEIKFDSVVDKVGFGHADVGMQFSFKIVSSGEHSSGYGLIWTYGGSLTCTEGKVSGEHGELFHGQSSREFCKGVTIAIWADSADHKGIYLLTDGKVRQSFENVDAFDGWHCLTIRIYGQEQDAKTAEFMLDDAMLGHAENWHEGDLEGSGKQVFVLGATAKNSENVKVEIQDIEMKTSKDVSGINLVEISSDRQPVQTSWMFTTAGITGVLLGVLVFVVFSRRSDYESVADGEQEALINA